MKLREKFWLWGQTPNLHHRANGYGLSSINKMTSFEGAMYFGIPNVCRVMMGGYPEPPFENEAMVLDSMDKVVWGMDVNDKEITEAVVEVANNHPNIIGAVLDDFFSDGSLAKQPPSAVKKARELLHTCASRPLQLWSVIYCTELFENRVPYINECDVLTFWTINAKYLINLEKNFEKLKLLAPDKPIYCGCYMWDYHRQRHIPISLMEYQLDVYYKWLKEGKIEGVILCSNCIGDIGLDAVSFTKKWLDKHGDEEI